MNKTRKQVKRKRSVIKTLSKKLIQNLFFVRRSQMKNIPSGGSIKAMKSVLCREIVLLSYKHLKLQMRLKIRGLDGNHSSFETRTLNGDFSLTPSLNLACIFFSFTFADCYNIYGDTECGKFKSVVLSYVSNRNSSLPKGKIIMRSGLWLSKLLEKFALIRLFEIIGMLLIVRQG